jgi:hypothetical protein
VRIHGTDEGGRFEEAAVADNVAPGGLYVRMKRRPAIGARLDGELTLPSGATIAATGHVLRLDALGDGGWGVAVRFTTAALLPAAS